MKRCVNLLPWELRLRQLLRRSRTEMCCIAAVIGLVGSGLAWTKQSGLRAARAAADRLETEVAPILNLRLENERYQSQFHEMSAGHSLVHRLETFRSPIVAVGLISRSASQCEGRVWLQRLTFLQTQEPAPPGKGQGPVASSAAPQSDNANHGAAAPPAPRGIITLQGAALENLDVARFVAVLRETKAFERVELKASIGGSSTGNPTQSYTVECTF